MSSKFLSIFAIASALLFFSCAKSDENVHALEKTEFYNDFLWCKYTPKVIDMGKIVVEFADDAEEMETSFRLGVFELDEDGRKKPLKSSVAQISFNGVETKDNQIDVNQDVSEVVLKAVFKPGAENKVHNWSVEVLDEGRNFEKLADENGDRIDAFSERFELEKEKIWNPLAKWLIIIILVIIVGNIIWLFMLKSFYFKTFEVASIQIKDPVQFRNLNVRKKYRKVILTNRNQEQGFFDKIYKGEIKYVISPIWSNNIELEPRDKNRIRVVARGGVFQVFPSNITRGAVCKITNTATKEITEITIK